MPLYICEECSTSYQPRGGSDRWCRTCAVVERACAYCGGFFQIRRSRLLESPRKGTYCSHACTTRATVDSRVRCGADNNRFNGGLCFDASKQRWVIHCRDGSLMHYYRGVMAAELGRLLRSDEIVHHVNGDTTDDRIENLQLTTRAEHMQMHRADLLAGAKR